MNKMNPERPEKVSESKAPRDLRKALAAKPLVEAVWKSLTPLARWDFVTWIDSHKQTEAKALKNLFSLLSRFLQTLL